MTKLKFSTYLISLILTDILLNWEFSTTLLEFKQQQLLRINPVAYVIHKRRI